MLNMEIYNKEKNEKKCTYLQCGKDYENTILSKFFPTASEMMQNLELIVQFKLPKLAVSAFRLGRMDGPTINIEKLRF